MAVCWERWDGKRPVVWVRGRGRERDGNVAVVRSMMGYRMAYRDVFEFTTDSIIALMSDSLKSPAVSTLAITVSNVAISIPVEAT